MTITIYHQTPVALKLSKIKNFIGDLFNDRLCPKPPNKHHWISKQSFDDHYILCTQVELGAKNKKCASNTKTYLYGCNYESSAPFLVRV